MIVQAKNDGGIGDWSAESSQYIAAKQILNLGRIQVARARI
jgi:hypothetical protein